MKISHIYYNIFYSGRTLIIISIVLAGFLIFATNQLTLRNFPNSADEYSYLISADIFSTWKLSTPTPQYKEFYYFFHVVNDGKFYSQYFPGWPFFLMFGVLLKIPMLINLLFGIFTIFITFLIAKEIASEKIAKITIFLMATSPYIIFNSASYFSHPSILFFSSLATLIYLKNEKSNKKLNWFFLGIVLGIAFNIRPFDALAVSFALTVHYLYVFVKGKKQLKMEMINWTLFIFALSILLGIFLLYNYLQTSNPFLTPLKKNSPDAKLGFNHGQSQSFKWALEYNIFQRSTHLNIWIPLCFIFMAIGLLTKNNYSKKWLLFLLFIALFTAYFFFAFYPGNQYGQRYLYTSSSAIFILIAIGLKKIRDKIKFILPLIIIINLVIFIYLSLIFHGEINQRLELYDKVKENNLSNAIVFLKCASNGYCSGKMPASDLTRNGIFFNNSILYVHNMEEKNILLMRQYPDRNYYIWKCENIELRNIKLLDIWISKNINCNLNKISK